MRYWVLAGWFACTVATSTPQASRTLHGELWAGTILRLHAVVTDGAGKSISQSNPAEVRVGQMVRWRVEYETMPYATTDRDAWFTLLVQNRGNGVDTLLPKLGSLEPPDATPWELRLYEALTPDQAFGGAPQVEETLTPLDPGKQRRLFLLARAPGDRNTDGVFVYWKAGSLADPSLWLERNFVAGMEATRNPISSATSWSNYPLAVPPALIEGRMWWVASSGSDARVFFTPQPLAVAGTFSNNIQVGAKLIGLQPSGRGLFTNEWLYIVSTNGLVGAFPLSQLNQTVSLSPVWLNLPFPVRANLSPVSDGVRLFFAGISDQVLLFDPLSGQTLILLPPTDSPITAMYALPDRIVVVARANGMFEIVQDGVRQRSNVRLPSAGTAPLTGVAYDTRRSTLLVSAGTRVGSYNFYSGQWLWMVNLGATVVGAPAYDFFTDSCYLLTAGGQVYALDSASGTIRPFYPQFCFNGLIQKATLTTLARQDRKVSYLYAQVQYADGTNEVRMITAVNPFNRFVSSVIPSGAVIGDYWLATGDTANDLLVAWCWRGVVVNGTQRGAFYAFRPR